MRPKESRPSFRRIASTPSKLLRQEMQDCYCFEPGMEKIQVEQVLGADMAQRVVEFDMDVPDPQPPIEQVIDVYVKDICIRSIDVIPDKVIVRGELEVKVMYVADLPNQPVRAFERKHVRWTRDISIPGAQKNDTATADVQIEFVDYDFHRHHHPRRVHITIVLRVWTRVTNTTEMDAYVINPVDTTGTYQDTTSASTITSSDGFNDGSVSAAQTGGGNIEGYGEQNVFITGPISPTGPIMPTAGTPTPVSGTATITANNVNVRTGPGTNFPVVSKVKKGTTMTIKDEAFGWYKVVLPDGNTTGWVASWLVDTGTGTPTAPKG